MKLIIIDDEAPARNLIREYLQNIEGLEILDECQNGYEALISIQKNKPDLILLDIEMPKINGFELLDVLDDKPKVIFITAYSEYAVKAFEENAIDYLLKPLNEERLISAIEKAKKDDNTNHSKVEKLINSNPEQYDRIVVKNGNKIKIIKDDDLIRIEADDDYIKIMDGDSNFLKKQTMKSISDRLDPQKFVRVHRSHILNVNFIEKIEAFGKDSHIAILKNNERVPISRSGYQELKVVLNL